jgi:hypothetical protein
MTDYSIGGSSGTTGLSSLANPQQNVKLPVVDPNDTFTAPAGSAGSDKVVTWAQVGAAASADIARVFTGGHSYASGYQNTEGGERWPTRLASALHAEEVTYAVTSAVLAQDDGGGHGGGYASVLNGIVPRATSAAAAWYPTPRNAAPYLPTAPVNVFYYGFNDLAYLTATTATNVAWFKMALRAVTCLSRAGGYFPDTDASVAYGGSGGSHWSANTGTAQYGSPTNHQTTTVNDKVTITVPADFPGGEVDLLTLAFGGGAKWSTTVDGGAAQVLDGTSDAFGAGSGRANLVVQRLTGLAAGTHTIVMTLVSFDSGSTPIFDSWLAAAPHLPLTVLCTQPLTPGLPYSAGGTHNPVTSTDIAALNVAINALPAEFTDGNVVVADVAAAVTTAGGNVAAGQPGSLFVSDGLHFNTAGHGLAAWVVLNTVRSAAAPGTAARFAPVGHLFRQIAPTGASGPEPKFQANWSAPGSPGAGYFSKGADGRAEVVMELVRSGAPSIGETIVQLPPGYAPESEKFFVALSWNGAFTTATPGLVGWRPDGTVVWYAGDPTTLLECFGTAYAGAPGS